MLANQQHTQSNILLLLVVAAELIKVIILVVVVLVVAMVLQGKPLLAPLLIRDKTTQLPLAEGVQALLLREEIRLLLGLL